MALRFNRASTLASELILIKPTCSSYVTHKKFKSTSFEVLESYRSHGIKSAKVNPLESANSAEFPSLSSLNLTDDAEVLHKGLYVVKWFI